MDPMPSATLQSATLKNLKPPSSGVLELWDDQARGLCLRVFSSGRATWTFRYRPQDGGARRRVGLGEYPTIGLAEARRRADRLRGDVSGGGDPQAARLAKRNALTVAELADRYLEDEVGPKKKPATLSLYKHYLRAMIGPKLGAKKAIAVTRADVGRVHRELGKDTPVSANRAIVALSGVFTFASKNELIPEGFNPARGTEKFPEEGRERYLTPKELGRLGTAIRVGETVGLAWHRVAGAGDAR